MRIPHAFAPLLLLLAGCATPGAPLQASAPEHVPAPALEPAELAPPAPDFASVARNARAQADLSVALAAALASVDHAVATGAESVGGYWSLPYEPLDAATILDPERTPTGSLSLGTIRQGRLLQPATLDAEGPFHSIIERHRSRNTHFGTHEIIDALLRAAEEVAREHGGAPLRVGNIAFKEGGPIPWSSSHQAGRDADLAFYALDEQGRSVPTPDLITFEDDGRARGYPLQFDVARNWALTRALLTDPEIRVQWLFVSEALKQQMLAHAVSIGEPDELIERAASVLHQPTDAPPHDDHLHVRIGCPLNDRLEGCQDWGPRWPWYEWNDQRVLARALALRPALDHTDPELRARALDFLQQLRPPLAGELVLYHSLNDPLPELRARALELLQELPPRTQAAARAIAQHLHSAELPSEERQSLYRTLAAASTPAAFTVARERLFNPELPLEERLWAAQSLRHDLSPELVLPILDQLPSAPPRLRAALASLLYRITARVDDLDWQLASETQRTQALTRWQHWWSSHHELPREQWLQEALHTLQPDVTWGDLHRIDTLIATLPTLHPAVAMNLSHIISSWTGRWAPRDFQTPAHAHRYWSRWWSRNRERMLNPDAPQAWN
ncbi:hypothetical protein DL240_06615 [Lujinxingia litoralis]|uniref:Penicillin-insensitive murein endopeptidase n=1 Tax=Lujinxingia litoralis TaxID=2211119 RepID=A0A328CCZ7_9DELT|nr:penicillin-insensitive murein endopeptidase [Lujinxingia litoralis]RAL23821.1 hypothetical protein DL240_06615 [Lujinxingia litoralis]